MLVLNATSLNTGHNWQFTSTWMGESPFSIDSEIDGNWRLRRMWYKEAPDEYRPETNGRRRIRLGQAVGASACVPGLFEPVTLPGLYPKELICGAYDELTLRLVDGGVHDNQGVASLLEQDCVSLLTLRRLDSGSRLWKLIRTGEERRLSGVRRLANATPVAPVTTIWRRRWSTAGS